MTTTLILIESSDDEDNERMMENGTHYAETYLHNNEGEQDEAVTARLRARLRKKPRFLHRYEIRKQSFLFSMNLFNRNLQTSTDQSTPEVMNINHDYCRIDTKTLKRKPFHRAGFFFYKRNSFRATKQVCENENFC